MKKIKDPDVKQKMADATAAYTGPIKQCPPGKARDNSLSPRIASDAAARWLARHPKKPAIPIAEQKCERRRMQMRQQQQRKVRDDKRNASEIRQVSRHQRIVTLKLKQAANQIIRVKGTT